MTLFDHVDLRVGDFSKVRSLYDALLPAMGFSRLNEDADSICYYRPDGDRRDPFSDLSSIRATVLTAPASRSARPVEPRSTA